jgi:hypothetical protein
VTPFISAVNVSAGLEGSVLLTHKGAGHGVFGHPSLCTGHAIRRYFVEGILPKEGQECEPDVDVWDVPDVLEGLLDPDMEGSGVLLGVGMERRSMSGKMTEEDVRMWLAMQEMGRKRAEMVRTSGETGTWS